MRRGRTLLAVRRHEIGNSKYEHVVGALNSRYTKQHFRRPELVDYPDYYSEEEYSDDDEVEVAARPPAVTIAALYEYTVALYDREDQDTVSEAQEAKEKDKISHRIENREDDEASRLAILRARKQRQRAIMIRQQFQVPQKPNGMQRRNSIVSLQAKVPQQPALLQRTSCPALLVAGPQEYNERLVRLQAMATHMNSLHAQDAWYYRTLTSRTGAVLVLLGVSRKLSGGFRLRIRPLVGLDIESARSLETQVTLNPVCHQDQDVAIETLHLATDKVQEALRALDKKNDLKETKQKAALVSRHPLYEHFKIAIRQLRIEMRSLTAFGLWKEAETRAKEEITSVVALPPSGHSSCAVCLSDECINFVSIAKCGHWCCTDCFAQYASSLARDGISKPKCPGPECSTPLSLAELSVMAGDGRRAADAVARLAHWQRDGLVAEDGSWCKCGHRVFRGEPRNASAACEFCERISCRQCSEATHLGIPCAAYVKFVAAQGILSDEERSRMYLQKYTRPCPRCGTAIEKNGGCLHVRCRRCDYYFCWACGGSATICGSFRCRSTGLAGINLSDSVGDGWWMQTRHAELSWAGIPANPTDRENAAIYVQRMAIKHKGLASSPKIPHSASHFTLYLLYLRRWAELAQLEDCVRTDTRKSSPYNLCQLATTLEAQLVALETESKKNPNDDSSCAPKHGHSATIPEFDLLSAQQTLDDAIAKSKLLGSDTPLRDYTRYTVIAAIIALARRQGLVSDLDSNKKQQDADRKRKPRRPTVISHTVTQRAPGQPKNLPPWQRGYKLT